MGFFNRMGKAIVGIHRFLAEHAFYALALATLLALACFAGRLYLSGRWEYLFLVWNLFLAWIPYLASLWGSMIRRLTPENPWLLMVPSALWLLFFPNAPYLVTDFIHIRHIDTFPWWFDLGLLALFAWSGCFLAVASLQAMQQIVRGLFGSVISWLFVLVASGLCGFGIYLGRFLRWNSWDLFFNPRPLLADIAAFLLDPRSHPQMIGVTGLFAAFVFVCYVTFLSSRAGQPLGLDADC
ncbi:MAG: DUF1361 domain-containing protein [Ardenticatenales bacterium]|nr:DUF1361 domain-containing protein [Ardenticatenales bacterium]